MSSIFRKVDTDLWDDEKFLELSDDARWVWLVLLTGPQTTPIPGLQIADALVIASTLRRPVEVVQRALEEIAGLGMCELDPRLRLIRLPRGVIRNLPDNPNQMRAWWKAWQALPQSPLKYRHLESIAVAGEKCGPWFEAVWSSTFGTVRGTVPERVRSTVTQTTAEAQHSTAQQKDTPRPEVVGGVSSAIAGPPPARSLPPAAAPPRSQPVQGELVPSRPTDAEYEAVYRLYPRKEGKAEGMAKLKRSCPTHRSLAEFKASVEAYARIVRGRPKDKIKHFSTFVEKDRWRDYLDETVLADATEAARDAEFDALGYDPVPTRQPSAMETVRRMREREREIAAESSEFELDGNGGDE